MRTAVVNKSQRTSSATGGKEWTYSFMLRCLPGEAGAPTFTLINSSTCSFSTDALHHPMVYPDSGISMDEELVLGDMIWSYNKAELLEK